MAKNQFIGEILHFNAVRMRVNGSGDLNVWLISLDDINQSQLPNISMISNTNIQPTILANFKDQRARLQAYTTEIDEVFTIDKIILFVRPIASEYPR